MIDEQRKATERICDTIRGVMVDLESTPGWTEWRKQKIGYTLGFDDPIAPAAPAKEFVFPDHMERNHRVVMTYLELAQSVEALRDVGFYFRRYPFAGKGISYRSHLTYMCEMYFSRFYEIRSRMKNTLNAANDKIGRKVISVGGFVKLFDQTFDSELRERNLVHHHDRFEDVELSRIFLGETMTLRGGPNSDYFKLAMRNRYRAVAKTWAKRVDRQAERVSLFLEGVAAAIVDNCNLPTATVEEATEALVKDIEATNTVIVGGGSVAP